MNGHPNYSAVVVGCGKLGTPLVGVLAEAGHSVVGIDLNESLVEKLSSGFVPWSEPGLQEIITSNFSRIRFVSKFQENIRGSDISFIIVPTPSNSDGSFSNEYVISAVTSIATELKQELNSPHTIVIVSTVMPGSTRGVISSTVNSVLGTNSHKVSLCYSPEFIALGSVIKNMKYPDIILIGGENKKSVDLLEEVSKSFALNEPKVFRLTTEEAEIAKISINSYVTTKISFSNQISELCERTPGTSAEKVLEAIGSDTRIGNSYLKAATAFGGPCFPRDNRALGVYAKSLGLISDLAIATDEINQRQGGRLLEIVQRRFSKGAHLVLVGASYKPDTDVIEESPSVQFAKYASDLGYKISVVDENVKEVPVKGVEVFSLENFESQLKFIDGLILLVPSIKYANLQKNLSEDKVLIDCWGPWSEFSEKFQQNYHRLGNYDQPK